MISEGIRFGRISVLTLRNRTDRPEQTVDPDQTPQNACKTFTETVMYGNSPRTGVYMPVCYHKRQNLTALASEDDRSLHWTHVLLS